MTIFLDCPDCGRTYRFPDKKGGTSTRCKSCKRPLQIPYKERSARGNADPPSIWVILGVYAVAIGLVCVVGAVAYLRQDSNPQAKAEKKEAVPLAHQPQPVFDDFDPNQLFDQPLGDPEPPFMEPDAPAPAAGPAPVPAAAPAEPPVPQNRPPVARWKHFPESYMIGERISAVAEASDPDGDSSYLEFRIGAQGQWQPDDRGQVAFAVPDYERTVQLRAVDDFGNYSEVVERTLAPQPNPWQRPSKVFEYRAGRTVGYHHFRETSEGFELSSKQINQEPAFVDVEFTPNGDTLLASGPMLRYWRLRGSGESLAAATAPQWCCHGGFTPDGKLYCFGGENGRLLVWEVGARAAAAISADPDATWKPACVAVSSDGTKVAFPGSNRSLQIWDLATMAEAGSFSTGPQRVGHVAWSQLDDVLLVVCESEVRAIGASDGRQRWRVDAGRPHAAYFSSQQPVVYILDAAGRRILQVAKDTGRQLASFDLARVELRREQGTVPAAEIGQPVDMNLSRDGQMLCVGTATGTVVWLRADDGKPLSSVQAHTGKVNAVAFSPDGQWLASAGMDGTVRLWSALGAPTANFAPDLAGDVPKPLREPTRVQWRAADPKPVMVAKEDKPADDEAKSAPDKSDEVSRREKKASLQLQLAERFKNSDPLKALEYASKALELAPKGSKVARDAKMLLDDIR